METSLGERGDFIQPLREQKEIVTRNQAGILEPSPQVRKFDLAHFKNRFSAEEGMYAVDVLIYESEIVQLEDQYGPKIRKWSKKRTEGEGRVRQANMRAAAATMAAPNVTRGGFHLEGSGKTLVQRTRIQSPAILRILAHIINSDEELWTKRPRTFIRPFGALMFHHKRVQQSLAGAEARWDSLEHLDPSVGAPSSMAVSEHDGSPNLPVDDCPSAIAELRAYVKSMDHEVMTYYADYDPDKPDKSLPTLQLAEWSVKENEPRPDKGDVLHDAVTRIRTWAMHLFVYQQEQLVWSFADIWTSRLSVFRLISNGISGAVQSQMTRGLLVTAQ